jgi:hypothetical protein
VPGVITFAQLRPEIPNQATEHRSQAKGYEVTETVENQNLIQDLSNEAGRGKGTR